MQNTLDFSLIDDAFSDVWTSNKGDYLLVNAFYGGYLIFTTNKLMLILETNYYADILKIPEIEILNYITNNMLENGCRVVNNISDI